MQCKLWTLSLVRQFGGQLASSLKAREWSWAIITAASPCRPSIGPLSSRPNGEGEVTPRGGPNVWTGEQAE